MAQWCSAARMTDGWRSWRALPAVPWSAASRPPRWSRAPRRSWAAGAEAATTSRRPVAATRSGSRTRSPRPARRLSERSAPDLSKRMRILAIDHGTARAGCAISDPTGTIARPLGVIEPPDPRAVAELAAENRAELVIVGLPVSLSGAEGQQATEARAFRDALAVILDIPVKTYDERLTTRMAERTARAGASAPPDALAAAHLLESYLQA